MEGVDSFGTAREFVAFKIRPTVKDGIEMSDTIIRNIVQCCLHCTNTLEEYNSRYYARFLICAL
jgi:hypothetical protein